MCFLLPLKIMPAPSDSLRAENIFHNFGEKVKSIYAKMISNIEDDEPLNQL